MDSQQHVELIKTYVSNGWSVLLEGLHGIGKTAIVQQAFTELGYSSLYFSASTMDPFTELVGVPKVVKNGKKNYLGMVKRPELEDDLVDAIFVDEFNRSLPTVRNALLEIIQYKTVHGHKLNRLKAIVVAINPDDSPIFEYDVERMDPTQRDKFVIQMDLPYEIAEDYVAQRYGTRGKRAVSWWNNLPDAAKYRVTPRRVCWALEVLEKGGRVQDVLPKNVDREGLVAVLSIEDDEQIKHLVETNDVEQARSLINNVDKQRVIVSIIESDDQLCTFWLPLIKSDEILAQAAKNNVRIYQHMLNHLNARYRKVLCAMLSSSKDSKLVKLAQKSELFDAPKAKPVSEEDIKSLDVISFQTLSKSMETFFSWIILCKENGTFKQLKKEMSHIVQSLSMFDDIKLSTTHYPYVFAELKDEKVKGLFELNNALFQAKQKWYKDRH